MSEKPLASPRVSPSSALRRRHQAPRRRPPGRATSPARAGRRRASRPTSEHDRHSRHRDHAGGQHASHRAVALYPSRSRAPAARRSWSCAHSCWSTAPPRPAERRASRRAALERRQPALVVPVPGGRGGVLGLPGADLLDQPRLNVSKSTRPASCRAAMPSAALPRLVEDELAVQARRRRRGGRVGDGAGTPGRGRSRSCCRASRARRARPRSGRPLPRGAAGRPGSAPRSWSPRPGSRSRREARHRTRGAPPAAPRPPARGRPGSCTSSAAGRAPATGSTSRACRRRRCGRRVCSRRRPSSHPRSRRIRAPRSRPRRPHAAASGSRGRPTPERRRARSAARGRS